MPDRPPDVHPGERPTAAYLNALRDLADRDIEFAPGQFEVVRVGRKTIVRLSSTGGGQVAGQVRAAYAASGVAAGSGSGYGTGTVQLLAASGSSSKTVVGTITVFNGYSVTIPSGTYITIGWDGGKWLVIERDC